MAILEKFGTIYLDGIPVPPGTCLLYTSDAADE